MKTQTKINIDHEKRVRKLEGQVPLCSGELLAWLREKLSDAEKSVRGREQMEATWREGDDSEWRAVAKRNGTRYMPKVERTAEADRQARITIKCRREVEMFKATLEIVSHANDKLSHSR